MSQKPVGDEISTQSDSSDSRLERLAVQFSFLFAAISIGLVTLMWLGPKFVQIFDSYLVFGDLSDRELVDRLSVVALILMIGIGFLISERVARLLDAQSLATVSTFTALPILVLSISWKWGDPSFGEFGRIFWYGWGDKFGLIVLATSFFTVLFVFGRNRPNLASEQRELLGVASVSSTTLLIVFYLPSVIQPFKGIVDTYHSRWVLNDLLIFPSGKFPFSEITPQYVALLGWPIRLFNFLPGDYVVNFSLVWVNFLALCEVLIIGAIAKKALEIRQWSVSLLIPTVVYLVKNQPNDNFWGSLGQHMNLFPGRTILPILSLLLLAQIAGNAFDQRNNLRLAFLGLVCALATLNNIEFGLPSAVSVTLIVLLLLKRKRLISSSLLIFGSSFFLSILVIIGFYRLNGFSLSIDSLLFNIRAFGASGFMNVPMPLFGLWVFFFAIFGVSAIIGLSTLAKKIGTNTSSREIVSTVLISFCGLWGSFTLFYFSGRSLAPNLVVYLVPLSLCIVGFIGLVFEFFENSSTNQIERLKQRRLLMLPLACLLLLPIASLTQAPNPGVEWSRVAGKGDRWSSRSLKRLPKYQEMNAIVLENPTNSYIYMGNDGPAFQILSGVENGLGIISVEDLLISPDIREFGCAPAFKSGADFALIPKADWANPPEPAPCDGFVLQPVDPDSEFLIYQIPSKVSS